ncbi:3-phosphoshikimate 1-carboxyvinyltransferase [uncultured archaeon]|nr:3-phosphoshikimate 1-carboxyvinyltransferase [uncultured archaeon]
MEVKGGRIKAGEVDSHNDHRIAMACAVAALSADGEVRIKNPECVSKSYPGFFEALEGLMK